ncbi:glycoside hydrolase family 6 protein [Geodermatophilus sp. SYSU D01036]
MRRDRTTRSRVAAALAAVAVLAGCGAGDPPAPAGAPADSSAGLDQPGGEGNPLAWNVLYANPASTAGQAVAAASERGDEATAERLRRIADRPTGTWLAGGVDPYRTARELTAAAQEVERVPLLVAYNLPQRDCGQYSSGGAADVDEYLDWLGSLAAGIGDAPAVVVLEPDAIPHALEGCAGSQSADERYSMLREAVRILGRQPETAVYVDAGNASWIDDQDALADALLASGIEEADGFALNTSNFETTEATAAYGTELSDRVGGAHFVVDTSRNGAGPPPGGGDGDHSAWCNPSGMRLGEPPTTDSGIERVDALLWIKQPGDSDGECGRGEPPAGQWFPEYADRLLAG